MSKKDPYGAVIRIHAETHKKLKILAAIEGLTLSQMIDKLITERENKP